MDLHDIKLSKENSGVKKCLETCFDYGWLIIWKEWVVILFIDLKLAECSDKAKKAHKC